MKSREDDAPDAAKAEKKKRALQYGQTVLGHRAAVATVRLTCCEAVSRLVQQGHVEHFVPEADHQHRDFLLLSGHCDRPQGCECALEGRSTVIHSV
jgi:hypothetical protein